MLLHFTRVDDDVMCFKHLSFLFLVHQIIVGSRIANIEKSRQCCTNEAIFTRTTKEVQIRSKTKEKKDIIKLYNYNLCTILESACNSQCSKAFELAATYLQEERNEESK